ncbi:MAG: hypothetical protein CL424_07955 [Acidimicrobiaceae bacterium]|nr:hypothetical protein [Acidimicrobiaceae bacterium]
MRREPVPIDRIDLEQLAHALDDHGGYLEWFFDPATGETVIDADADAVGPENVLDRDTVIRITPMPSHDAYDDMVRFAEAVGDPVDRRNLLRALEGKGAFRRFRDVIYGDDRLATVWRQFERVAKERRALDWLDERRLVDVDDLEAARAERRAHEPQILIELATSDRPSFDVGEVPERWSDIIGHVDAGTAVDVTRDGRPWARIDVVDEA